MKRRDVLALGATALPLCGDARQQRFRPIQISGAPDPAGHSVSARRLLRRGRPPWADRMKSLLGTVVIENQGGGGSSLGAAAVARSQPDGYTILLGGGGALVINPIASSKPLFDPVRDFDPISLVFAHAFALSVHPSLPVRTLTDLIDYARGNPGKMSYASAGAGSVNHLTGELFKSLTALPDIVHIPYRGAGPAITTSISGQVPMAIPSMNGQVLEFHRAGKLRVLAVTSPDRLKGAPEIPTAVEAGIAGMVSQNLVGLFAPRGTPRPIIEQISQATRSALSESEIPTAIDRVRLRAGRRFRPRQLAAFRRGGNRQVAAGHPGDRPEARLRATGVAPAVNRPWPGRSLRRRSGTSRALASRVLISAAGQGRPKR